MSMIDFSGSQDKIHNIVAQAQQLSNSDVQSALLTYINTQIPTLKIAIIAGGNGYEREISLRSGQEIANALKDKKQTVTLLDLSNNVLEQLNNFSPDVVWPALHGNYGEDGSIQDILSLTNYPFIGSVGGSSRITFDKRASKSILRANNFPCPNGYALPHEIFKHLGVNNIFHLLPHQITLPLVIKPNTGGSALGVSIISDYNELPQALVNSYSYSSQSLIEEYIEGTEISVSVIELGQDIYALPPVEITVDNGFYDFESRYLPGNTQFFVPARITQQTQQLLKQLAIKAHQLLRIRDFSRIDLIIDKQGNPYIIEVNSHPGITETSLLPQSLTCLNINFADFCLSMVRNAYIRNFNL